MIEETKFSSDDSLEKVTIYTDEHVVSNQYCSYRIEIETAQDIIVIEGCHDQTPEILYHASKNHRREGG